MMCEIFADVEAVMNSAVIADPVAGPGQRAADAWFTPARFVCLLGLFILAAYPDVVLGSHSFFYRDFGVFGYPLAHYHRTCFWRGEVPLWNPLNNCGLPFLAQWNTMVFYPLSLVYLLLPLPWSLNLFCLGHLLLAGAGMFLLARHWTGNQLAASVAGLAYALNGLMLHSLMWPNNIAALGWMPLVVLLVTRAWREGGRRIIAAAFVGATQMLAGAPEIIAFTWLLLMSIAVGELWRAELPRWRVLRRFTLVVALVTGLSAAQLLPFLDLLAQSQRDRTYGGDIWAMPAWGLLNFVVPLFHCSPSILGVYSQNEQQWTSSYYLGIGVVALALLGLWRVRQPRLLWLAAVALAGVVLAMGENGWASVVLQKLVPLFGFVRFPIKFVVLTVFAAPLLAAFAVNWMRSRQEIELPRARRSLLSVTVFLLVCVLLVLAVARWFPFPDDSWTTTWHSGLGRAALLVLVAGTMWAHLRMSDSPRRILVGLSLLILIGLDGLTHTPRQNPAVVWRAYGPLTLPMAVVPRQGESRAMISPQMRAFFDNAATPNALENYLGHRRALYCNCNLLEEVPKTDGFYSLYVRQLSQVNGLLYGRTLASRGPLLDFLGVAQISSPDVLFGWTNRQSCLPLATAGQQVIFAEAEATLRALASPDFDPRRVVFLPPSAMEFVPATNAATATILSQKWSAHKVDIVANAAAPSVLVLAQTFYHPWKATVDGKPAQLLRANQAFQAVPIPAGRHEVRLVYRDLLFRYGAVISVLTLVGCVSAWSGLGRAGERQAGLLRLFA